MRFPYTGRELPPIPVIPGSEIEWEPLVLMRVGGPTADNLVMGLVDTGASISVLPARYMKRLGIVSIGEIPLVSSGLKFTAKLGRVDFELRTSIASPHSHRWSALVGFDPRRDRAIWGQMGFLEHFLASFNTAQRHLTLRPNWTFSAPLFDG